MVSHLLRKWFPPLRNLGMHDFLLRLESLPESPGDGWEQILDSGDWVYEIEPHEDACSDIFEILSRVEGDLLRSASLFLHVNVPATEAKPLLFTPAFLDRLSSFGVHLEIACI